MKEMLIEHPGNKIVITKVNGRPNVVTLKTIVGAILHDIHSQPSDIDQKAEKLNTIQTKYTENDSVLNIGQIRSKLVEYNLITYSV